MQLSLPLILLTVLALPAHAAEQSALDPKGESAAQIAGITWTLFTGGSVIFIAVMMLLGIALFGRQKQRFLLGKRGFIIGGGVIFPIVVLASLLIYTFAAPAAMRRNDVSPEVRVEVTGELWWWRVKYLDRRGTTMFETANEIRIPADKPIELLLKTSEVIHSFWVPNLAGKLDLVPGHVNRLRIHANTPGVFRGQCAEYCGAQHAKMAFYVVAQPEPEFQAWLDAQTRPAAPPADAQSRLGEQLFLNNRCGQCHTVRGSGAAGSLGPDLTHIGSRMSIAAGILPNYRGTIAAWITDNQTIKPGNRMPSYKQFSGEELNAIAAYISSLR